LGQKNRNQVEVNNFFIKNRTEIESRGKSHNHHITSVWHTYVHWANNEIRACVQYF